MSSLTDERLAFLAVRPQLQKRAAPWWAKLFVVLQGRGRTHVWRDGMPVYSAPPGADVVKGRMLDYVLAADIAAQRLSADERAVLRSTGQVPAWFLDAVDEAFEQVRRRR